MLGGLHEGFISPGGGWVNLDFYREACASFEPLVMLLGEGTFHQYHGGVATNVPHAQHPKDAFKAEYAGVRGKELTILEKDATFIGRVPPQALGFLEFSVQRAQERRRGR